jgi:hypothetical protein
MDHKAEVDAAAVRFADRVKRLLADNPDWPQPADPFTGLPEAGRATCDRDHVS